MRLFLDANVLFTAAHNPAGKAALVLELGAAGHWKLFASNYALAEAQRNLEIKFPSALPRLKALQEVIVLVGDDHIIDCPATLPAKDQPIYRAAHAAGASHLLTGDLRDFGPIMNAPHLTGGMVVQTVAQFLGNRR